MLFMFMFMHKVQGTLLWCMRVYNMADPQWGGIVSLIAILAGKYRTDWILE